MKDLINFLKKYGGWQWYGNDKATRNIVNKLNQINNTHTTELFIDDCIKGRESNFSVNFLEELKKISNSHNSLNIANSIDNQILNKQ